MIRAVILFFCAATIPFALVGQGNITTYDLPLKVKQLMERMCCNCDIQKVWMPMDYSFYNFEYTVNGEQYHTSIDSSGHWDRTFQEVIHDSIPRECMDVYEAQRSVYDAKAYAGSDFRSKELEGKARDKEFKVQRVLKEYDELAREGYYDFVIQKRNGYSIMDGDTFIVMDTEHIKVSFDCQLLNYAGRLVTYIKGEPLLGYRYNAYDPSTYNTNTTVVEYSNGMIDGLYIQYFNFPGEVASVEYYIKGVPKGPYFYYHENGKLRAIGYYGDGDKVIDKWDYDGTRMLRKVQYDTLSSRYMDIHMKPLNGRSVLDGWNVYFTNGRIDSAVSDVGKLTGCHDNYIDSTRTLIFYADDGLINNIRIIKRILMGVKIRDFEGFAYLSDQSEFAKETYEIMYYLGSKVVMERGAYKNGKKVGKWYHYNEQGRRIKTYRYVED